MYFLSKVIILKIIFEALSTLMINWRSYIEFFTFGFSTTRISLLYIFLEIFVIAIKLGFYNIAVSSEKENIPADIAVYATEFVTSMRYIVVNTYSFFFFLLLTVPTVIGPYFFINLYAYYNIFTIQVDNNGLNYNHIKCLQKGRELSRNFTISLFFINTILVPVYILLYLIVPTNLVFSDIDISFMIKNIFLDCILVHFIYTAHRINDVKKEKEAINRQREEASREEMLRGRTVR